MVNPPGLSRAVEYLEASLGSMLATLNLSSITSFGNSKAAMRFCIAFPFPVLPPEDEEPLAVCEMNFGFGIVMNSSSLSNGSEYTDEVDFLVRLGRRECTPGWALKNGLV